MRRTSDQYGGAAALAITKRVSKSLVDYGQRTHIVAALERYERRGIDCHPDQSVEYVVTDDDSRGSERVRLALEAPQSTTLTTT
ncbi:hypothetical protein HYG81_13855 [Natrinema zhouii]|uniref:DNA-directed DNA polymerase n=1 Tax=Natrinema zhouii TaxID=1710539 RepID=A0A7D6CPM3_9EURY|nr:hypothetical protein [Natrinema zhouii]QLK25170.1 hypothetical protein HYG81_13855 [Natrinema zhouii]